MTRPQGFYEISRSGDMNIHQGVATDGTYIYGIHTDSIYKWDNSYSLITSNLTADNDAGINHLGGGAIKDGVLYIACEDYTPGASTKMRIAKFNTSDLSYIGYEDISAQGVEVSGLCFVGSEIWVSSFENSAFYKYNATTFTYIGSVSLSSTFSQVQDVTYNGTDIFFTTGSGYVWKCATDGTVNLQSYWNAGNEGIDFTQEYMLVLEDLTESIIYKLGINPNYSDSNSIATFIGVLT